MTYYRSNYKLCKLSCEYMVSRIIGSALALINCALYNAGLRERKTPLKIMYTTILINNKLITKYFQKKIFSSYLKLSNYMKYKKMTSDIDALIA